MKKELGKDIVREVLEEASRLSLTELENFLSKRSIVRERYLTVLRAIANSRCRWHEIKKELEDRERRRIQDSVLSRILGALRKASFIEKRLDGRNVRYEIANPMLSYALRNPLK